MRFRHYFLLITFLYQSTGISYCQGEIPFISSINQSRVLFSNKDSLSLAIGYPDEQIIVFVFHAEEDTIGLDPGLSTDGRWRAINLLKTFKEVPFKYYFTTPFRNNILTIQPLADSKNLKQILYDQADIQVLIKNIDKLYPEPILLVVQPETLSYIFEYLSGIKFTHKMTRNLSENLIILRRSMTKSSQWKQCRYRIR